MIKLTLISGTTLYADCSFNLFNSFMNTANKGSVACLEAYKEKELTSKVFVQLKNVEFFEEV